MSHRAQPASNASELRGYRPGWLAKGSVLVAAGSYFVGMYYDGRRGADLSQAAFLQVLVPFLFAAPASIVGFVAYLLSWRASPSRQRRIGDVSFAVTMMAECGAVLIANHMR